MFDNNVDVKKIIDEIKEEIQKEKQLDELQAETFSEITTNETNEELFDCVSDEVKLNNEENQMLVANEVIAEKADETFDEIEIKEDSDYIETEEVLENKTDKKKISTVSVISNILFYAALIILVLGIYFSTLGEGVAKLPFGFSFANVLSSSMESEIPKGSLVVIKETDAKMLTVGDNITFLTEGNVTYTHKIVSIFEDFDNTGMRAFETKGTENPMPDKEIVFEGNVVGKVVRHVPELGSILSYLKENIFIVIGLFVVLAVFSFLLSIIFSSDKNKKEPKHKKEDTKENVYKYG